MTVKHAVAPTEPWGKLRLNSSKSQVVIDANGYEFAVAVTSERARRIVACLNACAGASTQALETAAAEETAILGQRLIFLHAVARREKW